MDLKQRLVKGALGSFGLKAASTGLAFVLNMLLARAVGSAGLGTYALAISWIGVLGLVAKLGFPQLLVRQVSVYAAQQHWPQLKGLLLRAYQVTAVTSLLTAAAAGIAIYHRHSNAPFIPVLLLAIITLPLSTLRRLNQSTMSGLQSVVSAQLPESLAAPMLMIALVLISNKHLSAFTAMEFYVGTLAFTALLGFYQLGHTIPRPVIESHASYDTRQWISMALPFMLFGALYTINTQTDTIMLGALSGSESVGKYMVANRLASLIVFVLMASNTALAPTMASLYSAGEKQKLRAIVTRSSRLVALFSSVLAAFIVLLRLPLLRLFGSEFVGADGALVALAVGQVVNALMGPAGMLLNMTGHERLALIAFAIGSVANIGLNSYLIPQYGILGAAIATAVSMTLWNIISWLLAIKYTGIDSTAIGLQKR